MTKVTISEKQAHAMAQVCLDLHDALGCKWGDNPYLTISQLKAAAQPAPMQEPVAWQVNGSMVVREDWIERLHWPFEYVATGRAVPDSWVPVLYTTPPAQPQPLTDDEYEGPFRFPSELRAMINDALDLFGTSEPAAQPAPVEPAAWMDALKDAFFDGFTSVETYNDTRLNSPEEAWANYEPPTPPAAQRKPLTDEQITDKDRLDWLTGNVSKESLMWVFFAPTKVQGDIRRVIDAAMDRDNGITKKGQP